MVTKLNILYNNVANNPQCKLITVFTSCKHSLSDVLCWLNLSQVVFHIAKYLLVTWKNIFPGVYFVGSNVYTIVYNNVEHYYTIYMIDFNIVRC